jgi:hypothetical protein
LELYKIAKVKFKEDMTIQTMASVIFLRFYCPTIIFPVKFALLNEGKGNHLSNYHYQLKFPKIHPKFTRLS